MIAALFLTGCSILSYAATEGVSINFLSSDLIAAIPLIFCMILFLAILMIFFFIGPTWIAFDGSARDRKGRITPLFVAPRGKIRYVQKTKGYALCSMLAWIAVFSTPGILLSAWALLELNLHEKFSEGPWILLTTVFISVSTTSTLAAKIRRPNRWRARRPDLFVRVTTSVAQFMVMTVLISAIASHSLNRGWTDYWSLVFLLGCSVVLGSAQFVVVAVISNISGRQGFLKRSVCCVLSLTAFFCLYQPTASLFPRPFFGAASAPYSQCFRVAVAPGDAVPVALKSVDFTSEDGTTWSPQLRALAPAEGSIQVRLRTAGAVTYRLPNSMLAQVISCRDSQPEKPPSKQT